MNRLGVVLSVGRNSPAAVAHIQAGDRIATVNSGFFLWPPPDIESVNIVHDGTIRPVTLRMTPAAPLPLGVKVDVLAGALVFFVSLSVGSALVLIRPSRMTWAFYVFCASTILVELGVYFSGSPTIYWALKISAPTRRSDGTAVELTRYPPVTRWCCICLRSMRPYA